MRVPPEFDEATLPDDVIAGEEDEAITSLRDNIGAWLLAMNAEGEPPMVAAGKLFDVLVQVMEPTMGLGAIRTALLMTYEKTYVEPMTFLHRTQAKELLDAISNARRKVEGKAYLVLPGDDGASH